MPVENGRVRLHVFLDWSSVEVFAANGEVVITDQIFPAADSNGVALYARGGTGRLVSFEAWPLGSIWPTTAARVQGRTDRARTSSDVSPNSGGVATSSMPSIR